MTGSPTIETVLESAEHHFLTRLDSIRQTPKGWLGMHFALSRKLDHITIVKDLSAIEARLAEAQQNAAAFCEGLAAQAGGLGEVVLYRFANTDVVLLIHPDGPDEDRKAQALYERMTAKLRPEFCDFERLENGMYAWQKLADAKFLSAKRIDAYHLMADAGKVASLSIRRQRRESPLVLICEDDRFTASYAANILNKEYDVVHVKSAEEAIIAHIENAPDIVFMDIHLPGLSGHEAVHAIRQIDPEAFVVMLSVDTEKSSIRSASINRAHGFLKKPFSKERLLNTVLKSPFVRRGRSGSPGSTYFH